MVSYLLGSRLTFCRDKTVSTFFMSIWTLYQYPEVTVIKEEFRGRFLTCSYLSSSLLVFSGRDTWNTEDRMVKRKCLRVKTIGSVPNEVLRFIYGIRWNRNKGSVSKNKTKTNLHSSNWSPVWNKVFENLNKVLNTTSIPWDPVRKSLIHTISWSKKQKVRKWIVIRKDNGYCPYLKCDTRRLGRSNCRGFDRSDKTSNSGN